MTHPSSEGPEVEPLCLDWAEVRRRQERTKQLLEQLRDIGEQLSHAADRLRQRIYYQAP